MIMIYILVGFVIGAAFGFVLHSAMSYAPEIGILHIDLTDIRKDLFQFELKKDIDEFIDADYVILKLDSKYEKDFKPKKIIPNWWLLELWPLLFWL